MVAPNDVRPLRAMNSFAIYFLFLYPKVNYFILYFYNARVAILTVHVPAEEVNFNLAFAADPSIVKVASDVLPMSGVEKSVNCIVPVRGFQTDTTVPAL